MGCQQLLSVEGLLADYLNSKYQRIRPIETQDDKSTIQALYFEMDSNGFLLH